MKKQKQIPIKKLIPSEYNPRKISDKDFEDLKQSLKKFDIVEPAVINTNPDRENIIIGGHQRIKAAKELGWSDFPCIGINLNQEDEKELNIRLNKNSGEFVPELLEKHFKVDNLVEWGFDSDEIDWNVDTVHEGLTDDDEIPEEIKEPVCKLGDLWQLGRHRLLCGDSTDESCVNLLMGGDVAELLFTSPPYSDMREYNNNKNLDIEHLIKFIGLYCNFTDFVIINLGIQRKNNEIFPYWNHFINEAKDNDLKFLSWNVWYRESPRSIGQQTAMFPIEHEWVFVFGRERKKINLTIPNKTKGEVNNHSYSRQKNGSIKKMKDCVIRNKRPLGTVQLIQPQLSRNVDSTVPAMFPVKLPEEYIKSMTVENDIIIDSFLGSGTTLIACEKTNRICYGMELDKHYCDIIIKRWEDFTGKTATKL